MLLSLPIVIDIIIDNNLTYANVCKAEVWEQLRDSIHVLKKGIKLFSKAEFKTRMLEVTVCEEYHLKKIQMLMIKIEKSRSKSESEQSKGTCDYMSSAEMSVTWHDEFIDKY